MSGDLWGDPDDYTEAKRKKRKKRDYYAEDCNGVYAGSDATTGTQGTANNYGLETIKSSEVDDLPRIKARLKKLEYENEKMRERNKSLGRKLDYWRGQSAELAELRKLKHSIDKDKNRSMIRALKRGIP